MPRRQRHAATDDAAIILHIGWRLAALLAGLLCLLLVIVASVLYLRTEAALLQSVQDDLRARASEEVPHLIDDAAGAGPLQPIHESSQEARSRGDIFIVFTDVHLHLLGSSWQPIRNTAP